MHLLPLHNSSTSNELAAIFANMIPRATCAAAIRIAPLARFCWDTSIGARGTLQLPVALVRMANPIIRPDSLDEDIQQIR